MVFFIVLHYMVEKITIDCVESIDKNNKNKKIIVVDNCSPNDSYNVLKQKFKNNDDVIVIRNNCNDGYARGMNFGYNYIKKYYNNIKFVVAMNNDMKILQSDFENEIAKSYKKTNFYIMVPDVYSVYKKIHQNPLEKPLRNLKDLEYNYRELKKISNFEILIKGFLSKIPGLLWLKNYIYRKKHLNNSYMMEQFDVPFHGSCIIFSQKYLEKSDYLFYPGTKFYYESQILDYICYKNKWRTYYNPKLQVLHYEDIATNKRFSSYYKRRKFQLENLEESLLEFKRIMEKDCKKGGK